MIAAVCSAPCAMQHRTESGLQARPLFFNDLQTVLAKLCHNCDTRFRLGFAYRVPTASPIQANPNRFEHVAIRHLFAVMIIYTEGTDDRRAMLAGPSALLTSQARKVRVSVLVQKVEKKAEQVALGSTEGPVSTCSPHRQALICPAIRRTL
jgi:hypothetical protein